MHSSSALCIKPSLKHNFSLNELFSFFPVWKYYIEYGSFLSFSVFMKLLVIILIYDRDIESWRERKRACMYMLQHIHVRQNPSFWIHSPLLPMWLLPFYPIQFSSLRNKLSLTPQFPNSFGQCFCVCTIKILIYSFVWFLFSFVLGRVFHAGLINILRYISFASITVHGWHCVYLAMNSISNILVISHL